MDYLLLVMEPKGQREARTEAEGQDAYAQMLAFAGDLQARGVLRGVNSLAGETQGIRVQVREGQPRFTDGPFSETKELIGGYFLVDCATADEAARLAAACPAAAWATIEVRPVGPCFT